jgi:hypothetical protein
MLNFGRKISWEEITFKTLAYTEFQCLRTEPMVFIKAGNDSTSRASISSSRRSVASAHFVTIFNSSLDMMSINFIQKSTRVHLIYEYIRHIYCISLYILFFTVAERRACTHCSMK